MFHHHDGERGDHHHHGPHHDHHHHPKHDEKHHHDDMVKPCNKARPQVLRAEAADFPSQRDEDERAHEIEVEEARAALDAAMADSIASCPELVDICGATPASTSAISFQSIAEPWPASETIPDMQQDWVSSSRASYETVDAALAAAAESVSSVSHVEGPAFTETAGARPAVEVARMMEPALDESFFQAGDANGAANSGSIESLDWLLDAQPAAQDSAMLPFVVSHHMRADPLPFHGSVDGFGGMRGRHDAMARPFPRAGAAPLQPPQMRCIMERARAAQASDTCQASVLRLEAAADALRAVDGAPPPPSADCALMLPALLLLVLVPVAVVRAVRRRGAAAQAVKFWRAIDRDPQLKASVEAAAGEALPPPPRDEPGQCASACARGVLRVVAVLTGLLALQFLVVMIMALVDALAGGGGGSSSSSGSSSSGSDASGDSGDDDDDGTFVFTFMPLAIVLWWGILLLVFVAFRAAARSTDDHPGAAPAAAAAAAASAPARPVQGRVVSWFRSNGGGGGAEQGYAPMTGTAPQPHGAVQESVYVPPEVPGTSSAV